MLFYLRTLFGKIMSWVCHLGESVACTWSAERNHCHWLRVTSEHQCLQQWEDLEVGGRCWVQNPLPSEELISKAMWMTQANTKWPCPLVALSYEKGAVKNYPSWGWREACETDELKAHSFPTLMGKELSKPSVKDAMAKKITSHGLPITA